MSKYIDADRLREKLNKWRDIQPTTVGLPRKATYEAMGVIQTIDHVLYLIDTLPEQPVEGLEEEIDKWVISLQNEPGSKWKHSDILRTARHFAEWGMNQCPLPEDTTIFLKGVAEGKRLMMDEAVDADVNTYEDIGAGTSWAEFVVKMPTKNLGNKVRIIVIKED